MVTAGNRVSKCLHQMKRQALKFIHLTLANQKGGKEALKQESPLKDINVSNDETYHFSKDCCLAKEKSRKKKERGMWHD